jgi:hypothetical protein
MWPSLLSIAALLAEPDVPHVPEPAEPDGALQPVRLVRIAVDDDPELAWVRAATEVGLARLEGVVPLLGDVRPAPGLERPTGAVPHTLALHRTDDRLQAVFCAPDGCDRWSGDAALDIPWIPADHVVQHVADRLRVPHVPGALDRTDDDYIRRKIQRALAHQDGSAADTDDAESAIRRALVLDRSLVVTQWLAARTGIDDDERVLHGLQRTHATHDFPVHGAGEAWAFARVGLIDPAATTWSATVAAAPHDIRFRYPAARAALAVEDWAGARRALDGLPSTERVERARIALADATQEGGADDAQLAAWQATTRSTEPVRRRIERRVAAGDLDGAGELATRLAARGRPRQARVLHHAVQANTAEDGPTPLERLDQELAAVDVAVAELDLLLHEVAVRQNRLLLQRRPYVPCPQPVREGLSGVTLLGSESRQAVEALRDRAGTLDDLRHEPDIAPVLDPDREHAIHAFEQDVQRQTRAYLAAVDIQHELVDDCS